jgi:hypothetical protein
VRSGSKMRGNVAADGTGADVCDALAHRTIPPR